MILLIQRYFYPLIWFLLALLGLSLGQLAATSVGLWLGSAQADQTEVAKTVSTANRQRPLSDYDVILQRNVFDPATRGSGSLSEATVPKPETRSAPEPVEAPKNISLLGTVAGGGDPLAMLRIDGDIEIVRIGDQPAGGMTVEYIGRLVVHLRHDDGSLSELNLQEGAQEEAQASTNVKRRQAPEQQRYNVRSVGENRWSIPSSEADRARSNLGELLKSAHLVPNVKNGSTEGFMVRMIRPNSLLDQLGLQVGDIVMEVNGVEMTSPEKALQIFTQLRDARNISLGLVRNGEQLSFDYAVD
ncbi:MAG: type II secretion system protein GspC [Desulfuromonadales bacterium]